MFSTIVTNSRCSACTSTPCTTVHAILLSTVHAIQPYRLGFTILTSSYVVTYVYTDPWRRPNCETLLQYDSNVGRVSYDDVKLVKPKIRQSAYAVLEYWSTEYSTGQISTGVIQVIYLQSGGQPRTWIFSQDEKEGIAGNIKGFRNFR